ncbi:hypothetical protein RhiirC2_716766 [Rhizophagus irregularis]|uniref:Uncharacterized protein n=1 Tax=Rhizophagus irregularis TaxID=588596 RepID=A0A2N1MQ40_9GLOM|nr:hypothetical protein RhiirC2_716766 [Rhizophagus irregularis]
MTVFQGVNLVLTVQELSICKRPWGNCAECVPWEAMKGQDGHHVDLFVQPRYRIGKDDSQRPLHNVSEGSTLIESQGCCSNLSMVVEIMESESNRHQLAVAANQGPCEVSSLTECMNAKSDYLSYFDEVKNFGFNHIILIGKREYGIIFLDCYGRLFELDMMFGVLWPLGNSLEEAKTKPWTGEVAWNIGDDGDIFDFEYCMCVNLDYFLNITLYNAFIRQESPEPQKPEEFYKKPQKKNKGKKKKNKKNGTVFNFINFYDHSFTYFFFSIIGFYDFYVKYIFFKPIQYRF